MTGPEVIAAWSELTGERWPVTLTPYDVEIDAVKFAQSGLTRDDLALVVRWTKAQIAKGNYGLNAMSLKWRTNSGNNWAKFQERLDLAKAWKGRGTNGTAPAQPQTAPAPAQRSDPALFEAGRAAMAATRKALSGGST